MIQHESTFTPFFVSNERIHVFDVEKYFNKEICNLFLKVIIGQEKSSYEKIIEEQDVISANKKINYSQLISKQQIDLVNKMLMKTNYENQMFSLFKWINIDCLLEKTWHYFFVE